MKKQFVPFGRLADMEVKHPERTAMRAGNAIFDDWEVQTWPNRASMAKSIRIQESAGSARKWKPCVPLSPGEGY